MINDLRFYVWAFDQFIGDIRDLVASPGNLPVQYSLDQLDEVFAREFEDDAEHQRYWWLYYDRAAEAVPLLESDGPEHFNHPVQGFHEHMDFEKIREYKETEAYINLVGANVDRKLGDLSGYHPNFYAEPLSPDHAGAIDVLNRYVKHIKDNNNFDSAWANFKFEGITLGSGVIQIGHGTNYNSSELALFKNYLKRRDYLTPAEMRSFEDVFNYHSMRYLPSFNVVRFRGASGPRSKSFSDPMHRQVHHFEHISVAEAKMKYPDYAHKIMPQISPKALEVSPELSLQYHEIKDMVTLIHHQVRFPVRETLSIPLLQPTGTIFNYQVEQPRYAIGRITRAEGCGIVDMDIDYYDHGTFDMVQWVNYPSTKHSCGIGTVKFGRDPAIVHNKLHNGALRYFGRQIKGGGFIAEGIVDDADLADMSRGNRWTKVDMTKLRNYVNRNESAKLSDFIIDNRPPSFPTAWAGLMELESQALDRAMKSGSAWRGERTGYSGLQQQVASQDAAMLHVNTHEELKTKVKEMSDILFPNVVQFDGDRQIEFAADNDYGDSQTYKLNSPELPVEKYDPSLGIYKMVPSYIKNHIGSMKFITKIEPESIVPKRPLERMNFFIQMLQFLFPYTQTPHGRILLRGFQTEGLRIPSLRNSLDQMEELDAQTAELQGQLQDLEREYQKFTDNREWAKNKAEANQNLLRLTHKFVSDLTQSNPQTLTQLLGQNQQNISGQLLQAIVSLLNGSANTPGQLPMLPENPLAAGQTQQFTPPGAAPAGPQAPTRRPEFRE